MEHDGDNHRPDLALSLKYLSAVGVKYNKADSNLLRTRATHPDFITHLVTAVLEISQHLDARELTDPHNPHVFRVLERICGELQWISDNWKLGIGDQGKLHQHQMIFPLILEMMHFLNCHPHLTNWKISFIFPNNLFWPEYEGLMSSGCPLKPSEAPCYMFR